MEWCCTVLMALACLPQDDGLERTLHPDGSTREEWQVNPSGERSGSYKAWHANGQEAVRGRYSKGLRTGRWRTWYDSGKRASSGKYAEDYRSGDWQYWTQDGDLDATESGDYSVERSEYTDGTLRAMGEMKDGVPHGRWDVDLGARAAQSRRRVPRRSLARAVALLARRRQFSTRIGSAASTTKDRAPPTSTWPRYLPTRSSSPCRRPDARRRSVRSRSATSCGSSPSTWRTGRGRKRTAALQQLSGTGRPLLAVVVREMLQLDLTLPDEVERAMTWERELLVPMCAGPHDGFSWPPPSRGPKRRTGVRSSIGRRSRTWRRTLRATSRSTCAAWRGRSPTCSVRRTTSCRR